MVVVCPNVTLEVYHFLQMHHVVVTQQNSLTEPHSMHLLRFLRDRTYMIYGALVPSDEPIHESRTCTLMRQFAPVEINVGDGAIRVEDQLKVRP